MNYYERHIGDYLKDTAHLSLLEHGVYARLLDVYYVREACIPAEDVARLVGARSKDERVALSAVLAEFFRAVDGAYVQDRCDREIARYRRKAEHNREVGKLGGRPRKSETQVVSDGKPTNGKVGSQTETPPKSPSRSKCQDSNIQIILIHILPLHLPLGILKY